MNLHEKGTVQGVERKWEAEPKRESNLKISKVGLVPREISSRSVQRVVTTRSWTMPFRIMTHWTMNSGHWCVWRERSRKATWQACHDAHRKMVKINDMKKEGSVGSRAKPVGYKVQQKSLLIRFRAQRVIIVEDHLSWSIVALWNGPRGGQCYLFRRVHI